MEQRTHLAIDASLVGVVTSLGENTATARLVATPAMVADDRGLVHGGFTFGLADYAAMCAVNHPNVVLGGATTRFLAPVRVGEEMVAQAWATTVSARKRLVEVSVRVGDRDVMTGTFDCFVLDRHVLDDA